MTVVRREVVIEGSNMRTYEYVTHYCFGIPYWVEKKLVHSVSNKIVLLQNPAIIKHDKG